MLYLNKPVAYLQDSDFDANGTLINPSIPKDKVVLILIQSSWCGYCTKAKPAFQQFANNNPNVFCATIQTDGEQPGEKELGKRINKISPNLQGFPDIIAYKNGKYVKANEFGRSEQDLQKFVNSL